LTLLWSVRIVFEMHGTLREKTGRASALATLCLLLLSPLTMQAQNKTPNQESALAAARVIAEQAKALEADKLWEKALPLRRKLTADLIDDFGEGSPQADQARRAIADSLSMLGRYAEARAVLDQCLAARLAALGGQHFQVADALIRIGETQRREGLLTNAVGSFARAEEIVSTQTDHQELFAAVLNSQALILIAQGDLSEAEKRWTRALALPGLAADRYMTARFWSSLGETRRALGRLGEAESDHRRALAIFADAPQTNPSRLMAEHLFASLLRELGKSSEAIALHERSIAALEAQRGADDLDILAMRRALGLALALDHQPAESLRVVEEGLERLSRLTRTNLPLFFNLQTDRADRLVDLGDYAAAGKAYESAIQRQQRESGPDHSMVWSAREHHALVAMRQGDFTAAHRQLEAVLEYRRLRAADSPRHRAEVLSTLLEWARFYAALGRRDEVSRVLRECLQLAGQHLNPMHPVVAEMWSESAFLAQSEGRLADAFAHHTKAREIRRAVYGENSVVTAMTQLRLAEIAALQGSFETALADARAAVSTFAKLLTDDSPVLAMARYHLAMHLHRLGHLVEAASFYESALPVLERAQSPSAAIVARDFSFLEIESGRWEEALRKATRASVRQEESWRDMLRFASASDRLAWQGSQNVFSALASAAGHDARPLAQAVLRFKGAVLDSLIEDVQLQMGTSPEIGSLREARHELYRLQLMATSRKPPGAGAVRSARGKVERIESAMAGKIAALDSNRRMLSATVDAVQAALPPDSTSHYAG